MWHQSATSASLQEPAYFLETDRRHSQMELSQHPSPFQTAAPGVCHSLQHGAVQLLQGDKRGLPDHTSQPLPGQSALLSTPSPREPQPSDLSINAAAADSPQPNAQPVHPADGACQPHAGLPSVGTEVCKDVQVRMCQLPEPQAAWCLPAISGFRPLGGCLPSVGAGHTDPYVQHPVLAVQLAQSTNCWR